MVKKLVIFFMLAIVVLLGGCYSEATDVKEETVEHTIVNKNKSRHRIRNKKPIIYDNEYYLCFEDGNTVEVDNKTYNNIKVGDRVILYYDVYYRGEKYLGSELKKIVDLDFPSENQNQ